MPVLLSGSSQFRDGEGMGVVRAVEAYVMCGSSEGIEMESRNKMKPGENSFFQILHRHSQGRSSQNRDRHVLKHRGVKWYLGCLHWERGNLQRICSCEV